MESRELHGGHVTRKVLKYLHDYYEKKVLVPTGSFIINTRRRVMAQDIFVLFLYFSS